mmetsp:Transcript_40091/g.110302  ORF Transcript_40091/g.110302 Transcript_40091/m.110302 type:complete len:224 (-) Transcript_40091:103-774(-)
MRCACLPFHLLGRRGDDGAAVDSLDVPEIYRARYCRLPPRSNLPPQLESRLAIISPGRPALREKAFVRNRGKFPLHFLHGTLFNQGLLGQAVYYFDSDEEGVVQTALTCWTLRPELEGPPGCCHGGCVASLLDDAFGAFTNTHLRSIGRSGAAVTAHLHVDYKSPTPLPGTAICVVTLEKIEGRKIFTKGSLFVEQSDGSQKLACEGSALFVELKEGYANMMK